MAKDYDIILDDNAFTTAESEMLALKKRVEELKKKLEKMYLDLSNALVTPAGKAIELKAGKVLIKPIEDLSLIIQHVSDTLNEIIGTGYYKDVWVKFDELNQNINFN
ncbi:hypothetical protein [Anaerosporobacter sp.]|uniref:hypothetical protein n=1 Tax=Anaerosporobacter sp. TaxID=1872529 RepID=UPI00289C1391|nr:hypothetical protein [Anaerosporobacter sp.]